MTARDVRAAVEPAKLKLVQGIVNKGTREAQLLTDKALASRGPPRALRAAGRPLLTLEPGAGSRQGVSVGGWGWRGCGPQRVSSGPRGSYRPAFSAPCPFLPSLLC